MAAAPLQREAHELFSECSVDLVCQRPGNRCTADDERCSSNLGGIREERRCMIRALAHSEIPDRSIEIEIGHAIGRADGKHVEFCEAMHKSYEGQLLGMRLQPIVGQSTITIEGDEARRKLAQDRRFAFIAPREFTIEHVGEAKHREARGSERTLRIG